MSLARLVRLGGRLVQSRGLGAKSCGLSIKGLGPVSPLARCPCPGVSYPSALSLFSLLSSVGSASCPSRSRGSCRLYVSDLDVVERGQATPSMSSTPGLFPQPIFLTEQPSLVSVPSERKGFPDACTPMCSPLCSNWTCLMRSQDSPFPVAFSNSMSGK